MGPVVSQLEREFAGRAEVRQYMIDKLTPGSPEHGAAFGLMTAIGLTRTPTYLVVDAGGRPRAMVAGATSYLTLRGALTGALGSPAAPSP